MENTEYETMYIIRPDVDGETKTALIERFDVTSKDNGVEVIESEDWGKRRFIHEINGYREGIYHIVRVSSPSSANVVNEFDRLAKINDDIVRHMIVKEEA